MDDRATFLSALNNNGLFAEIQEIIKTDPRRALGKDLNTFYKKRWSYIVSYYTQDILTQGGFRNIGQIMDYLNAYDQPISHLMEMNINNMCNDCIIEIACYVYGFTMEHARQNNWIMGNELSPKFLNFDEWAMQQIRAIRYDV